MSFAAREVLRCIDAATAAQEHHPSLYAQYARADRKGRYRTCLQFVRALERYKTRGIAVGSRRDHDQVERVDLIWEEAEAREREEEFGVVRRSMDADRRGRRGEMAIHDRLRLALDGLHAISTVPAANPAAGRGGESLGLPDFKQRTALDECDGDLRAIRARVARIEDRLDEARGLVVLGSTLTMSTEEKNKVILDDWEGVAAAEVSAIAPWLGGSETIRRVRRAQDRDTLGHKLADRSNEGTPAWARAS
jgi:hypothetical protein